ncbi:MAG: hypothetical protein VW875_09310 [Planctomycetaceae bacterium]
MRTNPLSNEQIVNPFETRWIRPDAMEYTPSKIRAESKLPALLDKVLNSASSWEIIGPHGVGKTTLAHSLCRIAATRCIPTELIRCGQVTFSEIRRCLQLPGQLTILDEFEQLRWWHRQRLRHLAKRGRVRFILIAHQSQGFPLLTNPQTDLKTLQSIVKRLQANQGFNEVVSLADVESLMAQHGRNFREVLFACYDLFHQRQIKSRQ